MALSTCKNLRHLLLPRLAGSLALLEGATRAGVVFCAHTGFERVKRPRDFINGALIDATIRVRLWSYAREDVPTDPEEIAAWFLARWFQLDQWLQTQGSV